MTTTTINITENDEMLQLNDALRSYLTGELNAVTAEDLALLADLLGQSLSFRDAFIAYILAPSEVSAEDMYLFESAPQSPETGNRMSAILNTRFTDGSKPDTDMFDRARDLMWIVAGVAGENTRCAAQTRAVVAYLYWWEGNDEEAIPAAMEALSLDEDCTLASIVMTAVVRNVHRNAA
ncbi:hypothetical protein [Bifidobacterium pseudolongum]|uniref:hypothetical protein n=1 Tax=Bifidobacterium pseudolongum TaxID=1694 RepID=UPI001020C0AA|nr:hypothetical protein [Bifidobacterium pseudolongum]RYQ65496.1 hypothetical protein PG2103B_1720 [Bifidobacterium pseudolongum subsp. globosum]